MTVESTGFKASDVLAGNLQKVLTDVTALSLVGKQLHWNITGEGFRSLHLFLDDVVDIAREASDEVAQRNTLPTVPETIIKTTDAEELAVAAINATVGTMRDVHEKVDAEDSASADILNDYIRRLEQQAWFIRSQNGQA